VKRLLILLALCLSLSGCADDDNTPTDSGGDYDTYWGVIETISAEGYIGDDLAFIGLLFVAIGTLDRLQNRLRKPRKPGLP
jgi:hypothetical protein